MHIDGPLLDVDISAPDAVQQLVAGIHPLRVGHEELEHPVLGGPERHGHLTHQDTVARLVQGQALEIDPFTLTGRPHAAQHGVDPRQQFAWREGLGHIVIGTALKACDFVAFLRTGRQHDDGHFAGFPIALERPGQLQTAHVREHPVDQHQVGSAVGQQRPGGAAILGLAHFKARAFEAEGDHLAYRPFILDDQYLFG